ncbi:MAG TPA: hemolysin III family protein [Gammaproteobacteria bacterium]|nr:hemolysin III family protein [Gammaproteobacteria bacterium]
MSNQEVLHQADYEFHPGEELWNTLLHFLGLLLVLGALPVLITLAAVHGSVLEVVTFSVYGATLAALYLVSTLYHHTKPGPLKRALRRADHITIYYLIAGTYTPFCLVALGGIMGWTLCGLLWALALLGTAFKLMVAHRFELLSTLLYIAKGWAGLVVIAPLYHALPLPSFVLVLVGGACYTLGVAFYTWEGLRYNHAIWHFFCLAGSVTQFIAVFFLLDLPLPI